MTRLDALERNVAVLDDAHWPETSELAIELVNRGTAHRLGYADPAVETTDGGGTDRLRDEYLTVAVVYGGVTDDLRDAAGAEASGP